MGCMRVSLPPSSLHGKHRRHRQVHGCHAPVGGLHHGGRALQDACCSRQRGRRADQLGRRRRRRGRAGRRRRGRAGRGRGRRRAGHVVRRGHAARQRARERVAHGEHGRLPRQRRVVAARGEQGVRHQAAEVAKADVEHGRRALDGQAVAGRGRHALQLQRGRHARGQRSMHASTRRMHMHLVKAHRVRKVEHRCAQNMFTWKAAHVGRVFHDLCQGLHAVCSLRCLPKRDWTYRHGIRPDGGEAGGHGAAQRAIEADVQVCHAAECVIRWQLERTAARKAALLPMSCSCA